VEIGESRPEDDDLVEKQRRDAVILRTSPARRKDLGAGKVPSTGSRIEAPPAETGCSTAPAAVRKLADRHRKLLNPA
jgi:hypothetical protein